MKRVLITGISGKNGRYLLEEMSKNRERDDLDNIHFKVLLRESSDTSFLDECPLDIERYYGSIDTKEDALKFVDGEYDTLLHIAGIQRSVQIVSAAIEKGVKRFILVHTTGIYSKYKEAGESYRQIDAKVKEICEEAKATLTILRPTMIYGSLNDGNISVFIKMVDKLRLFPVINGAKYELQPVWCKDLGKAFYDVLMNPEITDSKEYDLSGGKPILLIDIFKEIGNQLGVKNTFISVPSSIAYLGAWIVYILTFKKKDYREKVQRMVEPRAYSYEKAANDFNYSPHEFKDGVKEEIIMYKQLKETKNK